MLHYRAMARLLLMLTLLACGRQEILAATTALMPLPVKMDSGTGWLEIDGSFRIAATGCADLRMEGAVKRITSRVSRQTGIAMGITPAGRPTLQVECGKPGPSIPALGEDEQYRLDVAPDGARLKAPTGTGVLHGLETFVQLIVPGANGFAAPAVHIEDRPRFPWRGLMIDVSRHWMPLTVIERNLDAMAAVKLNVFHWHLSDDQGFRVESKLYPETAANGLGRLLLHAGRRSADWWRTRATAASAWCPSSICRGTPRAGWSAIRNWPARPGRTRSAARSAIFDPVHGPDPRKRPTSFSTASSARWRRCFPTRTSTSAATR